MFAIPFQEIIFSSSINTWIFFVSAFAILGGGIKYIDDAFDENTFSKTKAMFLTPIIAVFWAYTMSLNPAAATILAAILLSVFISGKIDNASLRVGFILAFLITLYLGVFAAVLWLPLIILVFAGILDEVGNDLVFNKKKINSFVKHFFEYRLVMKILVFYFILVNYFDIVYFFAFIAFDLVYEVVNLYSKKLLVNQTSI